MIRITVTVTSRVSDYRATYTHDYPDMDAVAAAQHCQRMNRQAQHAEQLQAGSGAYETRHFTYMEVPA